MTLDRELGGLEVAGLVLEEAGSGSVVEELEVRVWLEVKRVEVERMEVERFEVERMEVREWVKVEVELERMEEKAMPL